MSFIDQDEDETTLLLQNTAAAAPLTGVDETAQIFAPVQGDQQQNEDDDDDDEGTGAVEYNGGGDLFVQDEAEDNAGGGGLALTDLGANLAAPDISGGAKKTRKPRGPPKPKKELTSEEIARRQLRKPRLDAKKSKKNKTQDDETAETYFAAQQSLGASVNLKDTVSRSLTNMMQENTLRSLGGGGEGSQQLGGGAPPALGVMNPSPFSVMLAGTQAPSGLQRQMSQGLGIGFGFGLPAASNNSQMVSPASGTGLPLSSPLTAGSAVGTSFFARQDSNTFTNAAEGNNNSSAAVNNNSGIGNSNGLADCTERMMSLVQQRKEAAIATAMVRSASFKTGPQFPATTVDTQNTKNNSKQDEDDDGSGSSEASSEDIELHIEETEEEVIIAAVEAKTATKAEIENTGAESELAVSRGKRNRNFEEGEEEADGDGKRDDEDDGTEAMTKEEKLALKRYEAGSEDDEQDDDAPPRPIKSGKYTTASATTGGKLVGNPIAGPAGNSQKQVTVPEATEAAEPTAEEEEAIKKEEELREQHLEALRRRHEIERLQKHYVMEQVKRNAASTQSQDEGGAMSLVSGVSPDLADSSTFASPTVMGAPTFSSNNKSQPIKAGATSTATTAAGASLLAATRRRDLMSKRTGSAFSKVSSDQVEALTRNNTFDKASAGPVVFGKKK